MRIRFALVAAVLLCGCGAPSVPVATGGDGAAGGSSSGAGSSTAGSSGASGTSSVNQADLYQSGSRIKAKVLVSNDGAQQFQGWYDSQLNIDCAFEKAPDGQMRCMPASSTYVMFYEDASCTQPVVHDNASSGACGVVNSAPAYAYWASTQCGALGLYSVGNQVAPPTKLYLRSGSTCLDVTSTESSYVFFSIGAQIDITKFASATLQLK